MHTLGAAGGGVVQSCQCRNRGVREDTVPNEEVHVNSPVSLSRGEESFPAKRVMDVQLSFTVCKAVVCNTNGLAEQLGVAAVRHT